ncbi:MAG: hypothetical protein ACI8UD_001661, partial [Planctomycetota bacterium]
MAARILRKRTPRKSPRSPVGGVGSGFGFGLAALARERNCPLFFELAFPSRQQIRVEAETVGDGSHRATLLDDLLNGFDLELATMLSGGLAHAVIILAEPHDSNLGVHFSGARS